MRKAIVSLCFFVLALAAVSGAGAASAPHWGNHSSTLGQRIGSLGLHALPQEGAAEHIHAHLDVYVGGHHVRVPAYVGIDFQQQFITELHTHDTTGIVHIESPTIRPFRLGQFFGEWDVALTADRIGSYRGAVKWWVNGKRRSGDPAKLVLASHQEIVLAEGPAPFVIPKTYSFPLGY